MLKHLFSLTCMNKKDRKKLAVTGVSPEDAVSMQNGHSPSSCGSFDPDDALNKSVALPEMINPLDTSQFMSKVIADASFDAANRQSRATPIDFGTREVKADDDLLSVVSSRRCANALTPSPIPEETEDNLTGTAFTPSPQDSPVPREDIFEPIENQHVTPQVKLRKMAEVYNSNEPSPSASSSSNNDDSSLRIDSVRARASKSSINQIFKPKLTPPFGGSLRPTRTKLAVIDLEMSNERVSTGSLGERLMLRTRSTRGSVRETLSKAIRSTLGRTSSAERKSMPDLPKFGTALTAMTSRTPSSEDRSSESGECDSPRQHRFSNKDCARIYFSSTSSEQSSRSNSSTPRRVRQTTSSSGFGSLSHLPPLAQRKSLEPLSSVMSQSMYVQSPPSFLDERRNSSSKPRIHCEDSSETWIPSSPSLTTLKDFMMTNDDEAFEEDFDFDNDDVKSVISSASTSRLFSVDRRMSKYQKHQTFRQFLNSPGDLNRFRLKVVLALVLTKCSGSFESDSQWGKTKVLERLLLPQVRAKHTFIIIF